MATELGFFLGGTLHSLQRQFQKLARNIVSYAGKGQITLKMVNGLNRQGPFSVIATDDGPGIPDVSPGHCETASPTSGSLGLGLPGVRRLMDEFEIASQPGRGTMVAVKKWRQ